jgi:hypothetical protein
MNITREDAISDIPQNLRLNATIPMVMEAAGHIERLVATVAKQQECIEALEKALKRIASETTQWDWDAKDGPNALVRILRQMRAEAKAALAPETSK